MPALPLIPTAAREGKGKALLNLPERENSFFLFPSCPENNAEAAEPPLKTLLEATGTKLHCRGGTDTSLKRHL